MKRRIGILLIVLLFLPCIFIFSACDEKKYDVNFMVNRSVYYTIQTSGNEKIALPSDPNIQGYDFEGWYFDNWTWQDKVTENSFENKKLTSHRYVYAKLVAKKYTITWENFDGTVLETDENVSYNTMPYYDGETPQKEGDVQYKYIFNGWSPNVSKVIGEQTYTAQFKQEINKYTISWLNEDGSLIKTADVDYGTMPSFNGIPTKEPEGKYYYTFKNWEPSLTTVVGDTQYTAIFEKHECTEFKVNYDANGGIGAPNAQIKYKNIDMVLSDLKPTKEGYRFIGWNNIYEDKIYHSGDIFSADFNLTLVAMWERLCSHCNGVGTVQNEVNCSTCSGEGSITSTTTTYCSNCDGMGEYLTSGSTCAICSGSGKTPSVCSTCNGYGGYYLCKCSSGHSWYANDSSKYCPYCSKYMFSGSRINTCSSCSGSGTVKKTCSICSGSGKVGVTVRTCSSCSGTGRKTITSTKTCSNCSGSGKKIQTTTCTYCNDGIIKPLAPTYLQINERSVVLKVVEGYEYSIDGNIWQQSNTFENLLPSTEYTFYQRVATKDNVPFGVTSLPLIVTTKSSNLFYVSYDLDGGTNHEDNPTQYYTSNPNVTLHNPTREHYDFAGWKYNGSIVTEIKTSWAKDIELTATWELHKYKIIYNLDGGATTNPDFYTIKSSEIILTDAIKKGYKFIGWTGSNGTTPQKNIAIPVGCSVDMEFSAHWEIISYTISYLLNEGINNSDNSKTYTIEDEIVFNTPTREHYEFVEWQENGIKIEDISKGTTGNKTITAIWKPIEYTITYELNDGNVSSNKTSYNIETDTFTLNNPTLDGYTFIGWSGTDLVGNENLNVEIKIGSHDNRHYIANWKAQQFTLTFEENGGSEVENITQDYDTSITLPKSNWDGKSLEGWYEDEDLTVKFTNKTMPAVNLTLYAKWISYDITISPNELLGLSINDQIKPIDLGIKATDTDGEKIDITLNTSGNFKVGETILIKATATGKYGITKQKIFNVKIYGMPTYTYNTEKDCINLTDELTPELFNAEGTDTFGEKTNCEISIKENIYNNGDLVTIILKFIDVANNEVQVEIPDIKIYGVPTIVCDTEKIKVVKNEDITQELIGAIAKDSFGKDVDVKIDIITALDTGIVNGEEFITYISSYDSAKYHYFTAYNTEEYSLYYKLSRSPSSSNCYAEFNIYCIDTNSYIVSTTSVSTSSYKSVNFNVVTGYKYRITIDRYYYSTETTMYLQSSTKSIDVLQFLVSKEIGLELIATDDYGNTAKKVVYLEVCDIPVINEPAKTLFNQNDVISIQSLGITAQDTFGDNISNIQLELISGEQTAGSIMKYLIIATDDAGNIATKEIEVKIYTKPAITYNENKLGIKDTDTITAELFNAVSKDSFGVNLNVSAELYEGEFVVGQKIKIKFTAIDILGNVCEVITDEIGVYSENDITLTYSQYLSDYIKLTSKGEEFNAKATDSFGQDIEIKVVATSGELAGGNIISLKLVATDNAGNYKESDIIKDIKVYHIPTIEYYKEINFIHETLEDLTFIFGGFDSFDSELIPTITIKSGERVAGQKVAYLVKVVDRAGNSFEQEYEFDVIADNQACVLFDINGGDTYDKQFQAININASFSTTVPTKANYVFIGWFDEKDIQYTDGEGRSLKELENVEAITFIAKWTLKYSLTYELNGGVADNPVSYTELDEFTLNNPTKAGYIFVGWTGSNGETAQLLVTISQGSIGDKNYSANWEIITYTITYELDGGFNNSNNISKYNVEREVIFYNPTREHYEFIEWQENGLKIEKISKGTTDNKTITAIWKPIEYTVEYNLVGGQFENEYPQKFTVETDDFELVTPIKEGYKFIGWTGSNGNTPQLDFSISKGSAGNKTYTANWDIIEYAISYNLNNGINNALNVNTYTIEDEILISEPTREGYTFVGWTGSNGSTPQTIVNIPKGSIGDKTYTANWDIINYTITYELNGGTNVSNFETYTIEDEIVLNNPTKEHYDFVEWQENGVKIEGISKGTTGNKTITAIWTPANYTITYDLDGGELNNDNPNSYNIETEDFELNNPTKEGYAFLGWTGSNGEEPTLQITIAIGSTGNKEYTANWEIITYSITYELNGTNNDNNPQQYTIEQEFVLNVPTKEHYDFVEWQENGVKIEKISKGTTGNKTITAIWKPVEYTITYELNGGRFENEYPTTYTVETDDFGLIMPIKEGYKFKGWTGSNGTTPQTNVGIPIGSFGDKVYTANWEIIEYAITYNLDNGINNQSNPNTYTIEDEIIFNKPAREHYEFVAWQENAVKIEKILKGTIGNKTITAIWMPIEYTITYNLNGGTNDTNNRDMYTIEDAFEFNDPIREYYKFIEWQENGVRIERILKGTTGNKTITAIWKPVEFTISYVLNGGANNTNNYHTYTVEDEFVFNNPTRAHYEFIEWQENGFKIEGVSKGTSGNKSITAIWTPIIYTITYNLSGGQNDISNKTTYSILDLSIKLYDAYYNNHYFGGWYLDNNYTQPISYISEPDNYVLFAKFIEATEGLIFGSAGGFGVLDYIGDSETVVIPSYYNNQIVTIIGKRAFYDKDIISILLPETINSIGERSFIYCDKLQYINLPNSLTEIGESAFTYCYSLKEITIPPKIKIIAKQAFDGCKGLENVIIQNGVEIIGIGAFQGCVKLTEIVIPKSIEQIDSYAFRNCSMLTSIYFRDTKGWWSVYKNAYITDILKDACDAANHLRSYYVEDTLYKLN